MQEKAEPGYRAVTGRDKLTPTRELPRAFWRAVGRTAAGRAVARRALERGLRIATERRAGSYVPYELVSAAFGRDLVISIPPAGLTHWMLSHARGPDGAILLRDSFLAAGDWRPLVHDLCHSSLVREVQEMFAADLDHRRTASYEALVDAVRSKGAIGHNYVHMDSPDKVDAYFEHHRWLIDSIRKHGLLPRREVADNPLIAPNGRAYRPKRLERKEEDVGVAIGPNGELYRFRGGFHRTAIAQCLGLERMPVAVKLVHADWLLRKMEECRLPAAEALLAGVEELGR